MDLLAVFVHTASRLLRLDVYLVAFTAFDHTRLVVSAKPEAIAFFLLYSSVCSAVVTVFCTA